MVQSIVPRQTTGSIAAAPRKGKSLGFELALPFTILAFILISDQSPLLKLQIDRIVDWLCDHDYVFNTLAFVVAAIPVWMIASMIRDKMLQPPS